MEAVGARPPAVAGAFYEADPKALAEQVESCFRDERRGPGRLPAPRRTEERRLRAVIVPHAGLVYSGAIAAHAYLRVAEERPPRAVLLLGVDHHGLGDFALSARPWRTPLGPVPPDPVLLGRLRRHPLAVDESAHRREHSLEVQLPFLQYVLPVPRIVALQIRFAPFADLAAAAAVVRSAVANDPEVLLLASTDLSHYLPPAEAQRADERALAALESGDARELYETVVRERISMCGIAPTTVLLEALTGEPLRVRRLRYGHSGEVEPMREVVGYAALAVEAAAASRGEKAG